MTKLDEAYEYLKNVYINMVKNAIKEEESKDEDSNQKDTLQIENKNKE